MSLTGSFLKYTLRFNFNARTSRGSLNEKDSFIIKIWDSAIPEVIGMGECAPLKGLSIDFKEDFEETISGIVDHFGDLTTPKTIDDAFNLAKKSVPKDYPSIRFGLEMALIDLMNGGKRLLFENGFSKGEIKIPINGLIWMGDLEFMLTQITEEIYDGFDCIKIKIGSLDFDRECDILEYIRNKYFRENIIVRVDANGAFKPEVAMERLDRLAKYNIHSIEQPIRAGQKEQMKELCQKSAVPIGLDEDLIGIGSVKEKRELLEYIRPQYLVLKPTLLGGFKACQEWIKIAEEKGIGWWITSALESNLGLNAIAQFAAQYPLDLHQGLGTGKLYDNNIISPLKVDSGHLNYEAGEEWDFSVLTETVDSGKKE